VLRKATKLPAVQKDRASATLSTDDAPWFLYFQEVARAMCRGKMRGCLFFDVRMTLESGKKEIFIPA
jgi:hypothetical protein